MKLPPLDLAIVIISATIMAIIVLVVLIEYIYGGTKSWI